MHKKVEESCFFKSLSGRKNIVSSGNIKNNIKNGSWLEQNLKMLEQGIDPSITYAMLLWKVSSKE